jgi:Holliday junction resolvase RusA-like endonuclease
MADRDILLWPEPVDQQKVAAHFLVYGEPVAKERARTVSKDGQSHTYTPQKTKDAEAKVLATYLEVGSYRVDMGDKNTKWGARMIFHRRNWVKRDIDNLTKLIMDALNGRVWHDDSAIDELLVWRGHDRQNPRTEVLCYIL